jgi:hypothetical protein
MITDLLIDIYLKYQNGIKMDATSYEVHLHHTDDTYYKIWLYPKEELSNMMYISRSFFDIFQNDVSLSDQISDIKIPFKLYDISVIVFLRVLQYDFHRVEKITCGSSKIVDQSGMKFEDKFFGKFTLCLLRLLDFFQVCKTELLFESLEKFMGLRSGIFDIDHSKLLSNIDIKYDHKQYSIVRDEKRKRFDMKFLSLMHLFDPILHYSEDENSYYQLSGKHTENCERNNEDNTKCMISKFLFYKRFLLEKYHTECINIIPKPHHLWEYYRILRCNNAFNRKDIIIDNIEKELADVEVVIDWEWTTRPKMVIYPYRDFFIIKCFMRNGNLHIYSINLSRTVEHENIIIQMMKNIKSKFDKQFDAYFP